MVVVAAALNWAGRAGARAVGWVACRAAAKVAAEAALPRAGRVAFQAVKAARAEAETGKGK